MPDDVDLSALIGREPEEIVSYFEDKGYRISWNWRDTLRAANARAFTVSGAMKMDVLKTLRGGVEKAIREGTTLREFQNDLEPELRRQGWWGRKEIVNPETGEVEERQLGSPHRLQTIYRTNLQTTYNAGRWKNQQASTRPFLRYIAILDAATRPSHEELHDTVARKDDPWWDSNYPPNGWGCRCRTQSLSERQVNRRDLEVQEGNALPDVADDAWSYNPGKAAFQPDLEQYDHRVARPYVEGVLSGAPFDNMYTRLRDDVRSYREQNPDADNEAVTQVLKQQRDVVQGDQLPVAVLDAEYRDMFDTSSQVVKLSDETLMKQLVEHPEVGAAEYVRVQAIIERAPTIIRSKPRHRVFVRQNGNLWMAVIKTTGDRDELYLQSFRRTNPDDLDRERRRGEVIKDELDV